MNIRRLLSVLLLPVLLGPAVTACGDDPTAAADITVLGPWIDNPNNDPAEPDEYDVFKKVLDAYEVSHKVEIDYRGTRAIDQALRAKAKDGTLPDIAILPTVGELASYATENLARPVSIVRPGPEVPSTGLAVDHRALWLDAQARAVAIKTDVKSLIVHRKREAAPASLAAAGGRTWCIGLSAPAEPAWPGTDWIEDLLLQQQNDDLTVYEGLASGTLAWTSDEMRMAWTAFAAYLGDGDPSPALLTTPEQAADKLVLPKPPCDLLHQSSYYAEEGTAFAFSGPRLEVAGDFAARFTPNPAADELLLELATGEPGDLWVAEGKGKVMPLDPKPSAAAFAGARATVVARLTTPGRRRCLDASDAMPATMSGAFQSAILEFVADDQRLKDKRLNALLERLEDVRRDTQAQHLSVHCTA